MIAQTLRLTLAVVAVSMGTAMANPYPPPPPPPPGAPMAPPPPPPPALEPCRADAQRYCQGIRPGAGRIRACMRSNQDRLSPACKQAITGVIEKRRQMRQERRQMRQERRQQMGYPPAPPPPPAPVTMAPVPN